MIKAKPQALLVSYNIQDSKSEHSFSVTLTIQKLFRPKANLRKF